MKIIKRDFSEVEFSKNKIYEAIMKAMTFGSGIIKPQIANEIAEEIEVEAKQVQDLDVYKVEAMVFNKLINKDEILTAKAYEGYRRVREFQRNVKNSTDESIMDLLCGKSEYWNEENSNKNAMLVTTQRDYMAGIESEDISKRMLLPPDIIQSHENGIIHFHDIDYFGQRTLHNCDLVNLEDMLQNGTVISGTLIEKPHSFSTACNIATQIIAQVASSQYGGQSISLTHLAPFVDVSRQKIRKEVECEIALCHGNPETINEITEKRLQKEIEKGVQTIQYQVVTLMTTNGQAPFLSVFMYLNETKDEQTKHDLALIIEEVLKQRIQGVKNEKGVWVTPAFPKLLYVLEEDNIHEDSKYFYLTKLAAECSAKRLVPDYISEKKMLEYKIDKNGNGNCYPCMGCVDGKEVITYRYKGKQYVETFERMWNRLEEDFVIKHQYSEDNPNLYMDLIGVEIFDTLKGFVNTERIIRNISDNWVKVYMSSGRSLTCTDDHPFETDCGEVLAKNLKKGNKVIINQTQIVGENTYDWSEDIAWAYGVLLCDGSVASTPLACFASSGEDDIINKLKSVIDTNYNISSKIKKQNRGEKGNYKEILMPSRALQYDLIKNFEGIQKECRHIPNIIFSMSYPVRLAFLAGMIDADGYVNTNTKLTKIQIGSTNKELALQQLALMQSLNMPAHLYENHYCKNSPEKIRYRIECVPTQDLINALCCQKKKGKISDTYTINNVEDNYLFGNIIIRVAEITSVERIDKSDYSYDVTTDSGHFEVSGIYSHNCRSFLTPYIDEDGNPKYYGRFNQGVVTINLPDIALSSGGDFDKFWELFDVRTELCHKALQLRHKRLEDTPSDVAPILWQHGALARLEKGEPINKLLHNGYSTLSLGYAGLYECVKYMTGHSHTDNGEGKAFGLKVMQALNDKCTQWKEAEHIDYSLYGSPIESTTYKFAKCLKKRFGEIEGITDRNYITNSYHVPVFEEINAFEKLALESEFQKLSPGGAISYVEIPNMNDNLEVIIQLIQFIYDNIMYAELNSKSDYCMVCGYDKEIKIITDENTGKLIWECPNCHNRNQNMMNVSRRTCGQE